MELVGSAKNVFRTPGKKAQKQSKIEKRDILYQVKMSLLLKHARIKIWQTDILKIKAHFKPFSVVKFVLNSLRSA